MRNCLTYALGMWLKEGGYILIRRSLFIKEFANAGKYHPARLVPHFLHRSKSMVVTQYVPSEKSAETMKSLSAFRKWLRLWNFDGVIAGDDPA